MRCKLLLFLSIILLFNFASAQITLNDPEIIINGETENLKQDELYSSYYSGDKVEVLFEIKNRYRDSDNLDFTNMSAKLTLANDSIDLNFFVDLRDSKDYKISLNVPDELERGFYNASFLFSALDTNGVYHNQEINFSIRIKSYENMIQIVSSKIVKDPNCESHELEIGLKNVGKNIEKQVKLELLNSEDNLIDELPLNQINLDESLTVSLYFSNLKSLYTLNVYDEFGNLFDTKEIISEISCINSNSDDEDLNQVVNNLPRSDFKNKIDALQNQLELDKYEQEIILSNQNVQNLDSQNGNSKGMLLIVLISVIAIFVLFTIFFRIKNS